MHPVLRPIWLPALAVLALSACTSTPGGEGTGEEGETGASETSGPIEPPAPSCMAAEGGGSAEVAAPVLRATLPANRPT